MSVNDMISRAAACECIGKMIHEYREKGEDDLADGMILARRYGIKRLPAVDDAPVVHGRWKAILNPFWGAEWGAECSECGYAKKNVWEWRFCPNCGAKMDENRKEKQV